MPNSSGSDSLAEFERNAIVQKLGDVSQLSPLVLRGRASRLRNKIAKLENQRYSARERDKKARSDYEKAVPAAQAQLGELRREIARLKADAHSYRERFSFLGLLAGDGFLRELNPEAAAKLRKLEETEYRLEISLGLEPAALSFRLDQAPTAKQRKFGYILESRPSPNADNEAKLEKQLALLGFELSILEMALGQEEARLAELEAFKGRATQETRDLARRLRLSFSPEDDCPYCGSPIGSDARLDHIYPVSKGGLSVRRNLVFVCLRCNQEKSDLTLAAFVRNKKLDRVAIESRLIELGKEF